MSPLEWPRHAGELIVTHNEHKGSYMTIDEALGTGCIYRRDDFPDEAEVQAAIAADSVWTIQWYPDTPVGFHRVHAATFEKALSLALDTPS